MTDSSPRSNRPDFIVASHPGTKLPCTKFVLYLGKASHNFVHCRALRGILLDHVGNERFDETETMVLLIYTIQKDLIVLE